MPNAFLKKLIKQSKTNLAIDKANKTDLDHVYTYADAGNHVAIYKINKHSDPSDGLYVDYFQREFTYHEDGFNPNYPSNSGDLFGEAIGDWVKNDGITPNIIKKCYNEIYDKVYVDRSNKYFGISSTKVYDITNNEDINDQKLDRITDFTYCPTGVPTMRFLLASAREPLIIHPVVQQQNPRIITPIIYGQYETNSIETDFGYKWVSDIYSDDSFNFSVDSYAYTEIRPSKLGILNVWSGANFREKEYITTFWLANNVFIGDIDGDNIDTDNAFRKPSFFSSHKIDNSDSNSMGYLTNLSAFCYNGNSTTKAIQFSSNKNSFLKSKTGETIPFDTRKYGRNGVSNSSEDPFKLDIGAMRPSILNDFDPYENEFYTADDYEYVPNYEYSKPSKYNAVRLLSNASYRLDDVSNRCTIFKPERYTSHHPTIKLGVGDNYYNYEYFLPDVVSFCCHFNSNSYSGRGYISNGNRAYCNSPKNEAFPDLYTEVVFNRIRIDLASSYLNLNDSSSSYSYFNPVLNQLENYYGKNFIFNDVQIGEIQRRKICNFFTPYRYDLEIQIFNDDVDIDDNDGYTSIGLKNEISLTGNLSSIDIGICKDLQLYEILKNKNPYILPKFTRVQLNKTVEHIHSNDNSSMTTIDQDFDIDNIENAIASEKKCISQKHKIRPDVFYKFNKYGYIDKSQLTYNYSRT